MIKSYWKHKDSDTLLIIFTQNPQKSFLITFIFIIYAWTPVDIAFPLCSWQPAP